MTALINAFSAINRYFQNAWVIQHLKALSDRELRDIGIERADIEAYVRGELARPAADPALVRPGMAANRRQGPVAKATSQAA